MSALDAEEYHYVELLVTRINEGINGLTHVLYCERLWPSEQTIIVLLIGTDDAGNDTWLMDGGMPDGWENGVDEEVITIRTMKALVTTAKIDKGMLQTGWESCAKLAVKEWRRTNNQ